ncbi:MAG: hypothetical protein ACM3TR_11490 [Caulobacteraceae bacterium]
MASKKELRALITLAGKVDPSLQTAFMKASAEAGHTSGKLGKLQAMASKGMQVAGKAAVAVGKVFIASAAAGATAMGALIIKASEAGDTLVKLRDKTGLTLEELQRLQYISSQVGANFESLPQAIGIMTKQMGAAKKGSKEATAAFKTLGIEVKDSVTGKLRPQSEVFKEVLLQLSNIKNESERNTLAFQLFGRGAADLFPILNAGAGDIEKLAAEADRLGLVMPTDTVEKLDELGDTMDRLKLAAKGMGNRLISRFLPQIMPLLNGMIDKLPVVESLISRTVGVFEGLGKGAGPIVTELLSKLIPIVIDVGKSVIGNLQSILPFIPMVMQPIMQILMMVMPLLKAAAPIITFLAKTILVGLGGALRFIMPVLQGFVNIITLLLQGLDWLIGGLGKLLGINSNKILANTNSSINSAAMAGGRKYATNPRAMKKHALGGRATSPSIFGDGPTPEYAIPAVRTSRSIGLLNQAAREIGVSVGGGVININYSPTYLGGSRTDIAAEFERQKEELRMMVEDILHGNARVQYGNI